MIRRRMPVSCLLALLLLVASASAAQACDVSWKNPINGDWNIATNWSTGAVPGPTDDVCITAAGTYKVRLFSAGEPTGDATVNSLTLGGGAGTQELDIAGEDYNYGGNNYNSTTLTLTKASTIASSGRLVLDATAGGAPTTGTMGGNAVLDTAALTNSGQIVTQSEDSNWKAYYEGSLVNQSSGSIPGILVKTGSLSLPSGNFGGIGYSYSYSLTNNGSMSVANGASLSLAGGGSFTNNGPVNNSGSITAGQMTWTQSGGSVSGNAVSMQNGAALIDSAGGGAFSFTNNHGSLSGTIPSGQTVTVQGATYSDQGNVYSSTSLALNAAGNTAPVVNNGTLVLDAPGSGSTSGGSALLTSGTLTNNGTLTSQVEDSNWRNYLEANLTNTPSGKVNLTNGSLVQHSTTANAGTVTIAPGALWILEGSAAFTNSGTIVPQIASATSVGGFQLNNGGPGSFTAGGTLAPATVGGFTPTAGQEFTVFALGGRPFTGTFGTVSGGFTADYSHETGSSTYVGVVFGAPTTTTAALTAGAVRAGKRAFTVALTCSARAGSCARATITGTVTEHLIGKKVTATTASKHKGRTKPTTKRVTVATGSVTLTAGTRKTLTVALNGTGKALLARFHKLTIIVTVSVGGKTVKSVDLVLHAPAKAKKKK